MDDWVAVWMILDELLQMLAGVAYCPECLCPCSSSQCLPCAIWPGLGSDPCARAAGNLTGTICWAAPLPQPAESPCAQGSLCTTLQESRVTSTCTYCLAELGCVWKQMELSIGKRTKLPPGTWNGCTTYEEYIFFFNLQTCIIYGLLIPKLGRL